MAREIRDLEPLFNGALIDLPEDVEGLRRTDNPGVPDAWDGVRQMFEAMCGPVTKPCEEESE